MVLAGGIFVAGKAVATNRNDIISSNVEALSDSEESRVGVGRICEPRSNSWCIYLNPYEEYEGWFISDNYVTPWQG